MATTGSVAHEINHVLRELSAVRDEARVRAHLLSQEAKQRFGDLELEIAGFERKLSGRGEWVAEQVLGTARALTHAVTELLSRSEDATVSRVRDVMTREVHSCHPEDTLNRAAQIMWDANCGSVPVVDAEGQLVGIITDRDVCMAAYTKGLPLSATSVAGSMSSGLYTCRAEDSLRKLMEVMTQYQVRRVPVVDDEGRLVGIVALADVARLAQAPTVKSHEARVWVSGVLAGISERVETHLGASGPRTKDRGQQTRA